MDYMQVLWEKYEVIMFIGLSLQIFGWNCLFSFELRQKPRKCVCKPSVSTEYIYFY